MRRPGPVWLWPWCLFLLLLPFEAIWYGIGAGLAFNGLGLFSALLLFVANRDRHRLLAGRGLAVALLITALNFSIFVSIRPRDTKEYLVSIGIAYLLYMLSTTPRLKVRHLDAPLRAWAWGGAMAAVCTLMAFAAGQTVVDGRASLILLGVQTDPNFFSGELLGPFAVALTLLRQPGRRLEGAVTAAVMALGVFVTQSRGGLLAMVAVPIALLALERRWAILGALVGAIAAGYAAIIPLYGRLDLLHDPTGSGRTDIWEIGLATGFQNWWCGIGLEAFPIVAAGAPGLFSDLSLHNTYLQAFVEAGLGALLALLAVWATHWPIRKDAPWATPLQAALVGVAVISVFLHLLTYRFIWIAWILAAQAQNADPSPERPSLRRPRLAIAR